ncbi:DUF4231 domain-containing protein [Clostridium sp. YIM B02515]|uniref:DUF4231 domain-containing protein n=1 Tax=Clostridium rhizosphaerae TaxID=2803861 RepID=A0ABS1TBJ0_9CLOT|nr:DUF4231 domain-containing protein [Clostridium rhizosphaerae]MBL4935674.1 DUF4231 domain-containing protein [Clostridium rhizosphaerae]
MNLKAKFNTFQEELNCSIGFFEDKHKRTKNRAYGIKITSVCFSALITVILGLSVSENLLVLFKDIALVLGAAVTIINAVDAFYNYGALWIKNTVTLSKLRELKIKSEMYLAGCQDSDLSEKKINEFIGEFQKILREDMKEWLRIRERVGRMEDVKENLIGGSTAIIQDKGVDKFRSEKTDISKSEENN